MSVFLLLEIHQQSTKKKLSSRVIHFNRLPVNFIKIEICRECNLKRLNLANSAMRETRRVLAKNLPTTAELTHFWKRKTKKSVFFKCKTKFFFS